jgi:protein associated with RNAse G/E
VRQSEARADGQALSPTLIPEGEGKGCLGANSSDLPMTINEVTATTKITVRVLKYDGTEYRRWAATMARQDDRMIVLDAEFEFDVQHHLLGGIPRGTRTVEYYWLDRWYNVFRFLETDGTTRLYYCNVNMPPTINHSVLSYIDLDIDILVRPDFSYQILDLEEFAANAAWYGYPEQVKTQAHEAVDELISMIKARQAPFVSNL